ncbi:MAG: RNA polymerase sigma factor [Butyricimonas faecihominis]
MPKSFVPHFTDKEREKNFHYLYEKYGITLRYFAIKYINDQDIISDIIQDAFVRLWEKMSQFKDENEAKAFLYKVVQNSCIDLIRHEAVAQKYVQHVNSEDTEEKSFLTTYWKLKYSKLYVLYLTNSLLLVKKYIYSVYREKAMKKSLNN